MATANGSENISRSPQAAPSVSRLGKRPKDIFDVLNDMFTDFYPSAWPSGPGALKGGERSFVPALDVQESAENIKVRAELPGLSREDFEVRWTDRGLVLRGQKKEEEIRDEGKCHYRETRYGSFERHIPLDPDLVDEDNLKADFSNGVLTVTIGKSKAAKPKDKKIEVG